MQVHPPHTAPRREATSDSTGPSVAEIAEESVLLLGGIVIGGPALPGFLFCVPGLLFFTAPLLLLLIVPAVALALVAAAVGLIVSLAAAPLLGGRWVARGLRRALDAPRALPALRQGGARREFRLQGRR